MKTYYLTIAVNNAGHIELMSIYIEAINLIEALNILKTRYGAIHNIVRILSITEDDVKLEQICFFTKCNITDKKRDIGHCKFSIINENGNPDCGYG